MTKKTTYPSQSIFRHTALWLLCLGLFLSGCATDDRMPTSAATEAEPTENAAAQACEATEPAWAKPPEDAAVLDPPAFGYYYVNEDQSMWASAYWSADGKEEIFLRAGKGGNKVGWFRPEGAAMEITGKRLDGEAPPMEAEASSGYPTRFQASGLYFPTGGCWKVTAKAGGSALSFTVYVYPED